jgi:hypothetical protein
LHNFGTVCGAADSCSLDGLLLLLLTQGLLLLLMDVLLLLILVVLLQRLDPKIDGSCKVCVPGSMSSLPSHLALLLLFFCCILSGATWMFCLCWCSSRKKYRALVDADSRQALCLKATLQLSFTLHCSSFEAEFWGFFAVLAENSAFEAGLELISSESSCKAVFKAEAKLARLLKLWYRYW